MGIRGRAVCGWSRLVSLRPGSTYVVVKLAVKVVVKLEMLWGYGGALFVVGLVSSLFGQVVYV